MYDVTDLRRSENSNARTPIKQDALLISELRLAEIGDVKHEKSAVCLCRNHLLPSMIKEDAIIIYRVKCNRRLIITYHEPR